jgi:dipeptidyl aminopeptidase/acylaminoacyl peptidase
MDGVQRRMNIERLLRLERPTGLVPLHLSPDGCRLAISVRPIHEGQPGAGGAWRNEEVRPSRIVIIDTATGEKRDPFPATSTSWGGAWSPDGERLAAWVAHEDSPCLGIWEVKADRVQLWRHAKVSPCYGAEVPRWTPDGKNVIVKLMAEDGPVPSHPHNPRLAADSRAIMVYSFDPASPFEAAAQPAGEAAGLVGDLGVVDADTGAVKRLARGWAFSGWQASPGGQAVAVMRRAASNAVSSRSGDGSFPHDLMVVPLDGSPVRRVAAGVSQVFGLGFRWSPDGGRLAYTDFPGGRTGRVHVVPADGSEEPSEMTPGAGIDLSGDPDLPPLWDEQGEALFALSLANREVWAFPPEPGECRRFPVGPGLQVRGWIHSPQGLSLPVQGGKVLLAVRDEATKDEGIALLDLSDGKVERLFSVARSFQYPDDFKVEASPDGSTCFVVTEAADSPPEVWRIGEFGRHARRLCALSDPLDATRVGMSRLVEWRTSEGQMLRGALLLPPTGGGEQKLPLVIRVYSGESSNALHRFGTGEPSNALLAGLGYAVLSPDLPPGRRDLMRRWTGMVLPAVDHLIRLGIVDSGRVGLIGESFGGYQVLSLLTQTTRFGAAVAISADVNLTSSYGTLTDAGGSASISAFEDEGGQVYLGGSPWARRESYIENSPLFYLDRVQTPVLLVAGTAHASDPYEAKQAFTALRRLGRRVELRLYVGEGHGTGYWSRANLLDLYRRVVAWFDLHLGQAPGPRSRGDGTTRPPDLASPQPGV